VFVALAFSAVLFSVIPAALFVINLSLYRPLPKSRKARLACSVLIPARDEEANLALAIESVLQSEGVQLELIILDDGSTDRTAEIIQDAARRDPRVRLAASLLADAEVASEFPAQTTPPLPPGWCGKNFACHRLAGLATYPLLVFMDADVRISRPDSLARLAQFAAESRAALISGVPRQQTETLLEKLIIPLIHFVLLAFLPLQRMRSSTDPSYAAACGQILAADRASYEKAGGHRAISNRIHDAVALARSFRAQGFSTDLFDATDTFHCRMYRSASEVWNGFAKNAHEGLASPRLIGPATALLLIGQIVPFFLIAALPFTDEGGFVWMLSGIAAVAALVPRLLAAGRFSQSLLGASLHPVGIGMLLGIQWSAFFRARRGRAVVWKNRRYGMTAATSRSS
jgi:hypothetical protein